jgi:protoporphyrinogen oxidase
MANHLRTWAFPLGGLTFDVKSRVFSAGTIYEEAIDPVKFASHCLNLRLSAEVRALHQETKTKSTAAVFGDEQKAVALAAPPAAFAAVFGAAKPPAPAAAAVPARVKTIPVEDDPLAALIPK